MTKKLLIILVLFFSSCQDQDITQKGNPFQEYLKTDKSQRLIDPYSYAKQLRETRFTNHELDSLPKFAIILHDTKVEEYLSFLKVKSSEIKKIQLGQVNPNYLFIIRSKSLGVDFIFNPGMPGAGGISSQAAILGALGVKYIVHIGTCGLFGKQISDSSLIVSQGAYNDGGAMLLDNNNTWPRKTLNYSDSSFSSLIFNTARENNLSMQKSFGVTIPIFFFQPIGFIKYNMNVNNFDSNEVPYYIEMEGAPFFAIGNLMHIKVASIVAGTDRYVMANDSLRHSFVSYDADNAKQSAVKLVIQTFKKLL